MNSKRNNEKIIQILSEMQPIHDETEEEKKQREEMAKEALKNATEESPWAFPRKVAGIICVALWAFSIFSLMLGFADFGVLLPFMLVSLGAVCILNIPVFFKQGKIGDVIVAIIASTVCIGFALGILFVGGSR